MRIFLSLAVLLLAACGFHPVYGVNKYTSVGVEEHLQNIEIANIPNREGQYLRNQLIDQFYRNGRPRNPQYTLEITSIAETERDLDITIDSDTTRGQLRLSTTMILIENETGEELLNRPLRSIASFNIIESEFANRVSEQDTRENLLNDIARQVEEHLALYFKNQH